MDFFLYHLRRKTYWSTIQFIDQYLNFYLPLRSLIRSIWYNFASTQMSCILKIVHVQWVTVMIELCIKMQLKNAVKCSLLVLPQSGSLPARKSESTRDLALIFRARPLKSLKIFPQAEESASCSKWHEWDRVYSFISIKRANNLLLCLINVYD